MPRKKIDGAVTNKPRLQFAAILAFFVGSSLEIADFALELVTDAVKQRHAKGKAVLAGRAKGADSQAAVDAATASALAPAAGAAVAPAKKKPGPPKGFGKGKGRKDAQAAGNATQAAPAAEVTEATALPPQAGSGVLDLDAPAQG